MKLISWNVNGIRAVLRKDKLLPMIEAEDPDILCLQEIKADPEQFELDLPGYQLIINSAKRKGYSGTAILSKLQPIRIIRNFPEKLVNSSQPDQYGDSNQEGRILAAEYPDYWLVNVYTPNAKDDLSRIPLRRDYWDPSFLSLLQSLEQTKPVLTCGDFNVAYTEDDLARPKQNQGKKGFTAEERTGFGNYLEAGFIDTFRLFHQGNGHYSWWSNWGKARENNVGWRIDYWLASQGLKSRIVAGDIYPDYLGSDHCPIGIELD